MDSLLHIRNTLLGDGTPKVCVPLVDSSPDTLLYHAILAKASGADLVEWRLDCLPPMEDIALLRLLKNVRAAVKDIPLLATFRTVEQGGRREIKQSSYGSMLRLMIASESIDLVDIELTCGEELLSLLVGEAKSKGVSVVISSHDIYSTPSREAMLSRLNRMRQLGADIPKLAVTPRSFTDVLSLLAISEEYFRTADHPFITMSMGSLGQLSRISGHFTGSAVTFGCTEESSAKGQFPVQGLRQILMILSEEQSKNE